MNDCPTYWDACIATLPPEKRVAATRAYQEIASGGEDGFFPKVFLLLEAHAAYTNTIPARITEAGEQVIGRVRELVDGHSNKSGTLSKEDMDQLLLAIRGVQGPDSTVGVKTQLDEMALDLNRLNRQVSRLRHFRVGMALFLIGLSMAISGGGVFWWMHQEKQGVLLEVPHGELGLNLYQGESSLQVFVKGRVGKILRIDKDGFTGVAAEIPVK